MKSCTDGIVWYVCLQTSGYASSVIQYWKVGTVPYITIKFFFPSTKIGKQRILKNKQTSLHLAKNEKQGNALWDLSSKWRNETNVPEMIFVRAISLELISVIFFYGVKAHSAVCELNCKRRFLTSFKLKKSQPNLINLKIRRINNIDFDY